MKKKETRNLIIAGLLIGIGAIVLMISGNPGNMGLCIACFIRDTAGALKLHTAPVVQYLRPEIIGIILGSYIIARSTNEFRPCGGSSPMTRFLLGMIVMIGALVFLGCPMRMVLRMAGGDAHAYVGFIGFILGVWTGSMYLKKGYTLKRSHKQTIAEGKTMPIVQMCFLLVWLIPFFKDQLAFSEKGPGSMHARVWLALLVGLMAGALAEKTRLCQAGGIRDILLFKDWTLFWGSFAVWIAALIMNLCTGNFNWGFDGQPVCSPNVLYNILGLYIVGMGSTLLGGCPMRQLVLSGTGNTDSAITVVGMCVGAAFAHNFGLASSGEGLGAHGAVATWICLVALFVIANLHTKQDA